MLTVTATEQGSEERMKLARQKWRKEQVARATCVWYGSCCTFLPFQLNSSQIVRASAANARFKRQPPQNLSYERCPESDWLSESAPHR